MPLPAPSPQKIKWGTIRNGIAASISAAAPNALVHNRWAMRYDLDSTIAALKNDSGDIHSWMLSVKNASANVAKVGGKEYETLLQIRIWGLLGYDYGDDSSNSQDTFENEVDNVIATLRAHSNRPYTFGISNMDGVEAIREIIIPDEFDLDVMGFGEGYDIHVAQGIMQVRIVR